MNGKTSPPPDPQTRTRHIRKSSAGNEPAYPFLLPPVEGDEIGRLGNYRVLRLLGAGGMGMVFGAEDIALRRPVALKVMRPEEEQKGDTSWQRFLREARAMAAIKHDNLVTVYQVGQEGETVYLAMELLEGESLDQWIDRSDLEEVTEILRIGREIALGLAAIHENGLVHRDIKPSNLWLEAPAGRVKILDFGLARPAGGDTLLTRTGVIVGTPAFLSPEQARGRPEDFRSDLFSLGCVLYRMCTRQLPFRGENTLDQLAALAADRPKPIHEVNPSIPKALAELVMELLAKEPADRPESARSVAARLLEIKRSRTQRRRKSAARSKERRHQDTEVIETSRDSWWQSTVARVSLILGLVGVATLTTILIVLNAGGPNGASINPGAGTGEKQFLSEMAKLEAINWPFHKGKGKGPPPPKEIYGPVSVQGQVSPHGIFMHASPPKDGPPSISYRLGKQYRKFSCQVSINDSSPGSTPLTFAVYGDGALLWKSKEISSQAQTEQCSIPVGNVDVLKLEISAWGEVRGAHGAWLEPTVEK